MVKLMTTKTSIKNYDLMEKIGSGGYGVVYRARHQQTGQEVALKVLLPDLLTDEVALRRFELEIQVINELRHPHIVQMLDHWKDEEAQTSYMVMPLLSGGNLRQALKNGPWSPSDILRVLEQIMGALRTAHAAQIAHRDLKPENILFDDNHNAYLVDFGLAKRLDRNSTITGPYGLVGSPAYLAPEQLLNLPITHRVDYYTLGLILYEMLVGAYPYDIERLGEIQLMMCQIREPLPDAHEKNPALPQAVTHFLHTMTAKDAEDRYPDDVSVLDAFREVIGE